MAGRCPLTPSVCSSAFFCVVCMKKNWSPKWIGSTQPRKQRKYRHNAPLHIRHKFLSAHLSRELRERFGKRSISVRKGDEVTVMKGGFRGFRGNVDRVDLSGTRIYIDGMKRKKVDGSEVSVPIHPSNVMITKLTLEDKMRQAVFERSGKPDKAKGAGARSVQKEEKPKAAVKEPKKAEGKIEGVKRRLPTQIPKKGE